MSMNRSISTIRNLPILISAAIILLGGAVRGVWTDRWTVDRAVEMASARLDRVPMAMGDWAGRPTEYDARDSSRAGITGGLVRRYVNRRDGAVVTLLIVCGHPGPISVHTPEVCYRGAGYDLLGRRFRRTIAPEGGDAPAEFWEIRLTKRGAVAPQDLGILYAWSADGDWRAPDRDARLTFAASPFLYKMYVVRELTPALESRQADPVPGFLGALLPGLRKSLFPPDDGAAGHIGRQRRPSMVEAM